MGKGGSRKSAGDKRRDESTRVLVVEEGRDFFDNLMSCYRHTV